MVARSAPPDMTAILQARDVSLQFGGLSALQNFNLTVEERELVGIIGPNGAGKTTAFNVLTGLYSPSQGSVWVQGRPTLGHAASRINAMGLARTFQNIRLFQGLSVLETVAVACHAKRSASWWTTLAALPGAAICEAGIEAHALQCLAQVGLQARAYDQAASLPYGEQRRLEIARALATDPICLLLDEPAAGLNAMERSQLITLIARLRSELNIAVVLIEHDMKLVMGLCERLLVLDHGSTIAEGSPADVRSNPAVIEAYLGDASFLATDTGSQRA